MAGEQLPQDNSLSTLTSLLGMVKGKSSTTTTSSNISDEGVNALIQQILGGSQGLAAVAGGQKSAGLYNSTVNQQLTNDLITRTAGEVAKTKAGTTTKTTSPPQISGGNILSLLTSLGAGKLITAGGKKVASSPLGQTVSANASALGETLMGSTSIPLSAFVEANSTADPLGALITSQGWSPGAGAGVKGALGTGAGLAGVSGAVDATGALVGATEVGDLLAAANATADPLAAFVGSLGYDVSAAGAATAGAELVGATEIGSAAAGAAGVAEGASFLEALPELAAVVGWVICTELNKQGKLSDELYAASGKRALTLPKEVINGYHFWAVPLTRKLRTSRFLSSVFAYLAKSRCEYLLGKPRIWGWLSVALGEPICGMIGHKVGRQDWETLYG